MEAEIERALDPGRFVSDRGCFRFVDSLEQAAAVIGRLVTNDPDGAATPYETFLAGCYEKAEEVDGSSGSFGMFAQSLIIGWITACQAAEACPQQTTTRLLAWMDNDQYGFCYRLEREIATVFDEAGLAAFIDQIRSRFEAADQTTTASVGSDQAARQRRAETLRWAEALRSLYAARGDWSVAWNSTPTGRTPPSPRTASLNSNPGSWPTWVTVSRHWRRHYRKHPDQYSYDHLMTFVPQAERPAWHDRAITAALDGDRYLPAVIELLLHTDETGRLGHLAARTSDSSLEGIGHHTAERAGTALEPGHPSEAARIWLAQGMRILKAGKSKYYGAALRYFEHAKRCYQQTDQPAQWQQVIDEVYAQHSRKTSFLPGFDEVVTGTGRPRSRPSSTRRRPDGPHPATNSGSAGVSRASADTAGSIRPLEVYRRRGASRRGACRNWRASVPR